jgi:hypothetical protein
MFTFFVSSALTESGAFVTEVKEPAGVKARAAELG